MYRSLPIISSEKVNDYALKEAYYIIDKMVFLAHPKQELFELSKDPDQLNNVAYDKAYAKISRKMDKMLTKKLKESEDPRMFGKGNLFKEYKWK